MCGIAGYSLSSGSRVDRTLVAQALLAGIAERGADAVGYAYRGRGDASPVVTKQRTPARELLEQVQVPGHATELLADFSCARAEPRMTVDSEAIFALAAHSENDPCALEALTGAMATAWLDQREPGVVFAARGVGRPLWLGRGRDEIFFASTRDALEVVAEYAGVRLRVSEVREGTFFTLQAGRVARTSRFRPDTNYVEKSPLPTVRAPGESAHCLSRLAAITAV